MTLLCCLWWRNWNLISFPFRDPFHVSPDRGEGTQSVSVFLSTSDRLSSPFYNEFAKKIKKEKENFFIFLRSRKFCIALKFAFCAICGSAGGRGRKSACCLYQSRAVSGWTCACGRTNWHESLSKPFKEKLIISQCEQQISNLLVLTQLTRLLT